MNSGLRLPLVMGRRLGRRVFLIELGCCQKNTIGIPARRVSGYVPVGHHEMRLTDEGDL